MLRFHGLLSAVGRLSSITDLLGHLLALLPGHIAALLPRNVFFFGQGALFIIKKSYISALGPTNNYLISLPEDIFESVSQEVFICKSLPEKSRQALLTHGPFLHVQDKIASLQQPEWKE